jgi:hypothetical protein
MPMPIDLLVENKMGLEILHSVAHVSFEQNPGSNGKERF